MKSKKKSSFNKVFTFSFISLVCIGSLLVSCNTGINNPPSSYETVDDSDFENMTALQFTKVMGNGINLGNTFEASGANWLGYNAAPSSYETAWGQPVTTKAMFAAYKKAGFDSVRIPIAWTSTMDWRNDDFEINSNFMNRIKEVVNWALEEDLIVMINDHWDYQWWGLFGYDKTTAYKIFDAIWDQVGTAFKDYPYQLFFEAGNEEWGERFNDEVDGKKGNLSESDQYELITELAQHFVDKIRDQGSKNEKRFLLIPGYGTGFDKTADYRYKMPKDPTNTINKLMVSVHYYSPALYSIADEPVDWGGLKDPATTWGTSAEVSEQNSIFNSMKKFVDAGYGVVVGEYAVAKLKVTSGGVTSFERKNNDVKWLTNVLDNCDRLGYAPFLWDCNGYFRKDGTQLGFEDNDIAEIYKNRNYASEKPAEEPAIEVEVGENGEIIKESSISCQAGDKISIKATISGAKNFNQIGLQTNVDAEGWHSKWENFGFDDNYKFEETITATENITNIYAKFIFQSLIDESIVTSKIKIIDFSVTVN